MEDVVKINQLTKVFNDKKAVDNVSFSIKSGEVVAILGPNGAGKTTTMLMMLGLLNPTNGEAKVFNEDAKQKSIRERIGVMLQEVSLMDRLKVKEIIGLFRSYYPNPLSMDQLIGLTGLSQEDLNKRTEKLSGGQKRRVGFALALAGNPDLLFFDEPTVGMDITARKVFWETVRKLANQGKTIIFSTHYLQEADDIADRIILFNKGSVVADGKPEDIKGKLTKQSVSFIALHDIPREMFIQLSHVSDVFKKDGRIFVMTDDTDSVLARLFELKLNVKDIRIEKGRLEEAFEQLTEKTREAM
ncbi:ABC transporter ATP-binding protein [Lederbergia citrea]|uniref:ABC transporter ATP-binding protein n=1 Tax=Lederbergia citrea TaxID=2833581 RepID=A0A942UQL2_9BACI|nr:ABC transporter ATP-binding protein [Lederbergia citrea]MBS4205383.1 ABC transporter ATP-binding protein [Lederbergia citrea]MBS4224302.1 ABC transporter ATP-binding protein [Lederbergia citrea]